jgi:hypothetical protein
LTALAVGAASAADDINSRAERVRQIHFFMMLPPLGINNENKI